MLTITKTISVKIFEPTKVKAEALQDLLNISGELSRFYISTMESLGTSSKKDLHKETYQQAKQDFPSIPTGLIQTIRDKAIETYKSYKARLQKKKRASLPCFKNPVVRFDNRTFTLHKTDNSFGYFVSVSTRQKRVLLPSIYGQFQAETLNKIFNGEYKFCTAELSFSKRLNCYCLNISYKYQVEEKTTCNTLGIDIGICNLAVLAVPGQTVKFFDGKKYNQKRSHYAQLRKALGKKKLLKKIKTIGNKEQRYMRDTNHKISCQIIDIAKRYNCTIQMEKLTNIRERVKLSRKMNKLLHNWNFRQLQTFIEYKALAEGLKVLYIKPEYTSQTCHKCGHIEKANRVSQAGFKCKNCGYSANADYNASMNIANYAVVG